MPRLKLRIQFDNLLLGPGKAELLERIAETGSISAAGRQMDMSYRRAWALVEEMNAAFREPLVQGARGGKGGGGALVTETGQQVLARYRHLLAAAEQAVAADVAALQALLRSDVSVGK
ncbi:winged helix-turn-helix domain-containing protein [Gemmobacter serpentinus]|uniref:winged helix-turn-helix domain-containing protein n=1 Tax=Gemmobacter serpentinus TaxID=2652247 RepID=UPI001CF637C8|nr:LysR family transcriptional regulator [Gemmobacter serpentinus]